MFRFERRKGFTNVVVLVEANVMVTEREEVGEMADKSWHARLSSLAW